MINTYAIKARMIDRGLTQTDIAARLSLSQPVISRKINGKRPFYLDEAQKLGSLLSLSAIEYDIFFFVPNCATQKFVRIDTGENPGK